MIHQEQHRVRLATSDTGLLAPLAAGGSAIIPAGGKFSASTHWKDAVEHEATFYTAVPTMHQVGISHQHMAHIACGIHRHMQQNRIRKSCKRLPNRLHIAAIMT